MRTKKRKIDNIPRRYVTERAGEKMAWWISTAVNVKRVKLSIGQRVLI